MNRTSQKLTKRYKRHFIENVALSATGRRQKRPCNRWQARKIYSSIEDGIVYPCWGRGYQWAIEKSRSIPLVALITALELLVMAGDVLPSASLKYPTCVQLGLGPVTLRANPFAEYPHSPTALIFNSQYTIRRSVVDHEEELKGPTISKKTNLGGGEPQYKADTSDWRSLEDVKVNSANKHDTSQNENSTTSKYLFFDNVGGMFSCFLLCTLV